MELFTKAIIEIDTDHVPHPSIPKHMRIVTQNWKKKMKKNTKKLKELSLLQRKKKLSKVAHLLSKNT